jgi:hypothetical protein
MSPERRVVAWIDFAAGDGEQRKRDERDESPAFRATGWIRRRHHAQGKVDPGATR